jgi:DNA polymerase I
VLQNAKYDQHVFANHGIALAGIAHDTMLQSYVIESDKGHDLGQLCTRHLGLETIAYEDLCGKGAKPDRLRPGRHRARRRPTPPRMPTSPCAAQTLHPQFADEGPDAHLWRDRDAGAQVLWQMERNGVLIDADLLAQQSHELGAEDHGAGSRRPTNWPASRSTSPRPSSSPKSCSSKLGLPVKKKTPSGGPSTDEEVLSELALDYPLPKLLLEHRSLPSSRAPTPTSCRAWSTRADRPRAHQLRAGVAVTGRLASSDPNLQNIPVRTAEGRRIRTAFIAPPGASIVSADYSQIELRIMAHLSGDERLLEAFAHGEDVHRATAAEIFGVTPLEVGPDQRRVAKASTSA